MKKYIFILVFYFMLMCSNPFYNQIKNSEEKKIKIFYEDYYNLSKLSHRNSLMWEALLEEYPEQQPTLGEYLGRIYAWEGKSDKALDFFENCISKNIWYNFDPNDADWKLIAQTNRFKKILKKFKEMKEVAKKNAKPLYDIVLPKNYKKNIKYPLYIALHHQNSNINELRYYYNCTTKKLNEEFIVVYAQSSQAINCYQFNWIDSNQAFTDIKKVFEEITKKYFVDTEKVILFGIGDGGRISLFTAMTNTIPIKGVITYDTTISIKPEKAVITNASKLGLKVVMYLNERVSDFTDEKNILKFSRETGLNIRVKVVQDNGTNLKKESIDSSIDFILKP